MHAWILGTHSCSSSPKKGYPTPGAPPPPTHRRTNTINPPPGRRPCAHLVLKQLTERLDERKLQVLGQPAHVMVALDGVRVLLAAAGRRARLNHVGVQRPLHQELALVVDRLLELVAERLEDLDELAANCLALVLRVGQALEPRHHRRDVVDARDGQVQVVLKRVHHALTLVEAQQPIVDKHAVQTVAQDLVHERRGHGGVDAAGECADGVVIRANLQIVHEPSSNQVSRPIQQLGSRSRAEKPTLKANGPRKTFRLWRTCRRWRRIARPSRHTHTITVAATWRFRTQCFHTSCLQITNVAKSTNNQAWPWINSTPWPWINSTPWPWINSTLRLNQKPAHYKGLQNISHPATASARPDTHRHTRTQTRHTHTHARMHARTHAQTHTHTHKYTHTQFCPTAPSARLQGAALLEHDTHLRLNLPKRLVEHLLHRPVGGEARNVGQEVLDHVKAAVGVHHLGMELEAKEAALRVLNRDDSALRGTGTRRAVGSSVAAPAAAAAASKAAAVAACSHAP
eukprot:351299-Chlamydomonas_euryale.AAC.6